MTRIGLIGAGRWGRNAARAMAKAGVLAWVADDDMENAHAVASEFGAERVRSGPMIDTLADKWSDIRVHGLGDCDAVWICTPIETHELLVHAALAAGKHVLCEKPLSRTKAQAEGLADEAKRAGLTLMCDFTWLGHAGVRSIVDMDVSRYSATRFAQDARGFDPLEDLLPHDVALSLRAFGDNVKRVIVDGGPTTTVAMDFYGDNIGRDRYFLTDAGNEMASGYATVHYSYERAEKVRRVEAWGESWVHEYKHAENNGELPDGAPEPLSVILDEFISAIREHRQPRIGGAAEFVHVAAVIEAAKASRAKGGEWVDVA